ncbi:pseudomurein-binding repeat-containing protein [Methanothermobacter wolfeii]|uniref:pseudomurein-binding repeat-containing protein n=1 Tax=Methanothermobacter wolfeii TaxID=145261 RepID=UPI0024B3C701|nr:pseudomurein-binding repeat-containing protein [Methanothermobacter wolfeii]MDI6701622.1 pseudomurein-binding repeat-containing protein [Methanothermobacter wolfeii]
MRSVCMLLACILLINLSSAGYAVNSDENTAPVADEDELAAEDSAGFQSTINQTDTLLSEESSSGTVSESLMESREGNSGPTSEDTAKTENGDLAPCEVKCETDCSINDSEDSEEYGDNSGTLYEAAGGTVITQEAVLLAAASLKTYIESSGKLPSTVTVGGQVLTVDQFMDLMLKTLLRISGTATALTVRTVQTAPNPSGTATGTLQKTAYLNLAKNVLNFINTNNRAPNYITAGIGKISYQSFIHAISKILTFHQTNKRLPNYVTVQRITSAITPAPAGNSSTSAAAPVSGSVTQEAVLLAAASLKTYIESSGKLPSTVTVGGQVLTVDQFMDLMLKTLLRISGTATALTVRTVQTAPNPSGTATGTLQKTAYLNLAKNVLNFINTNNRAPNYITAGIGKISYQSFIHAISKILTFHQTNKRLPNYVTVQRITSTSPPASLKTRRENDPYNGEGLSGYLVATANCQVNDSTIRSLAANLTAGLSSAWDKATAIFNWVRDKVSYSFYYNTRYGAVNTLKYRTGNCVDQTHLLIALFRASGLAARYVHGTCTFNSGNTYGHVWAQVLVGDTWYAADPTSSSNSLGAVRNWNTATATIRGKYASLPF